MPIKGIEKLDKLIEKLKGLQSAMNDQLIEIIEREKPALVEINRQYLEEGVKPSGEDISDAGYSDTYKLYKQRYGRYKNTSYVDLKFSGKFLDSFVLEYQGDLTWQFSSSDVKAGFLMRYGELFGLNEKDLEDFAKNLVEPELVEFIEQYLEV
jgi:hypothetical protein